MNISKKIEKNLTKRTVVMLRRVGAMAQCLGYKAYLVGGSVRDILLEQKSPDIDIVVVGDAIRLADAVAKEFKDKFKTYRPFGTCTITLKGGKRMDLATARKESYKKPGAFPTVRPSRLKDDLFRRDFTVNAIAASIGPKDFGRVFDYFGGIKDLSAGVIKVMHGKSFIDDPTRILRAMRFAARFGFKIDDRTEVLIERAIANNAFRTISQGRIRKELSLMLDICR